MRRILLASVLLTAAACEPELQSTDETLCMGFENQTGNFTSVCPTSQCTDRKKSVSYSSLYPNASVGSFSRCLGTATASGGCAEVSGAELAALEQDKPTAYAEMRYYGNLSDTSSDYFANAYFKFDYRIANDFSVEGLRKAFQSAYFEVRTQWVTTSPNYIQRIISPDVRDVEFVSYENGFLHVKGRIPLDQLQYVFLDILPCIPNSQGYCITTNCNYAPRAGDEGYLDFDLTAGYDFYDPNK